MEILGGIARTAVREGMRHAAQQQRQAPRHAGTVAVRQQDAPAARQPPREPVDGAALLANVCKWLRRYLYLDSEAKYWALALWIAGSHFRDEKGELVHETFPIAGFLSDEPGSGKTHALEILSILCPEAPSILTEPSEAAIARLIGKHRRTILLDEGDILFGAGRRKAAIRAILNSGYKQGGTWPRASKGDVEDVPTYGAKAIAALKTAKTGTGTDLIALFTRILEFEMTKPPAGTELHKLRESWQVTNVATGRPERITGRDIGRHLHDQMQDFAVQERGALAAAIPEVPGGVELREEEKWLPLIGVAERADDSHNRAGREHQGDSCEDSREWTEKAWAACTDLSLYGGTPDAQPEYASAIGTIIDGWDAGEAGPGSIAFHGGEDDAPEPAPAAAYIAGYARTEPGGQPEGGRFPQDFASLHDAQRACEDHALSECGTGDLGWQEISESDWGATVNSENGTVFDYAVSAVTEGTQ